MLASANAQRRALVLGPAETFVFLLRQRQQPKHSVITGETLGCESGLGRKKPLGLIKLGPLCAFAEPKSEGCCDLWGRLARVPSYHLPLVEQEEAGVATLLPALSQHVVRVR